MWGILTRRRFSLRCCATPVLLCAPLLSLALTSSSPFPARKNVLIITEVGITHRAAALVTESLMSAVSADREYQVEFYGESLDSTASENQVSEQREENSVLEQYGDRKIDAIVVMGPRPIRFMSRFSATFLPNVPVIFGGSTREQAGNPKLDSRFTGSWMEFEPAKTLDAAIKLIPGTQHVVVVGGSSAFDKWFVAASRASLSSYSAKLDITYLTDLTMTDLRERLRHLPRRTIVLYTSFFRDVAGNEFINATTALPMISEAANAPVFSISDTYLGHGMVGGCVLDFAEQGKIASQMVLDIFKGRNPRDIPVQLSPSVYMFDWKQLQHWGLSERNLPPGSLVLYREPSLWQRIRWIVFLSVLAMLSLISLCAYLLFNRRQLGLARDEQMRLGGMLINAQEGERKRVASELHDDFSQRLALLSLGLETAAELVAEFPNQASDQLHELFNSTAELGADLHTLSHRLHSSTLERLGLVPGIGAFCKEFSSQQGVQVLFTHHGGGGSVPSDVALCLFRIVQESLRNVKKHSGASQTRVVLEHVRRDLHLSISDDGVGFEVTGLAQKQGLGRFSMEERAHLIGARFEIRSQPGRGTQVNVWMRLPEEKPAEEEPAAQAGTQSTKGDETFRADLGIGAGAKA